MHEIPTTRQLFETYLKANDRVRVKRSSGEIEDDWILHNLDQLDINHNGQLEDVAMCVKPTEEGVLRKLIPIKELEELNPQ